MLFRSGEVKAFLHTYYNQIASLQDRSTYTFWEHYYGVSQHKTHEEGWFLMQTRWMLWMEEPETRTLNLLPGIPRAWLDKDHIHLQNCASYFGKFSLHVQPEAEGVRVRFAFAEPPSSTTRLRVRLPLRAAIDSTHLAAVRWDPALQTLTLDVGAKPIDLLLRFSRV